jgi:hypothetical protein
MIKKYKILIWLSLIAFLIKWVPSFYFYKEDISIKIIFDAVSDGYYHLPSAKYLAELEFRNSYDPYVGDLKILPVVFGSIFFHSIFFKIFGLKGFIIIEFFGTFVFLLIFFKIFNKFYNKNSSILFSIFLFLIPQIISLININNINYVNVLQDIFSLRIHRPFPSILFFFLFIYYVIKIDQKKINNSNSLKLGVVQGFSFLSFYYYAIIEICFFFIYLIFTHKKKIFKEIFLNINYYIKYILSFMTISSIAIINLFYHESDVSIKDGLYNLNLEKKAKLLEYYLNQFTNIKFLIVTIILLCLYYFYNIKRNLGYKLLNIFFYLVLGSIIAPLFFLIISPKYSILYHFNNSIILSCWLFILMFFINYVISIIGKKKIFNIYIAISILIIISVNIKIFNNNKINTISRLEFQDITQKIIEINDRKISILTFDEKFMIWSIFNNIKYLNVINITWSPKNFDMIEKDLIKNFKFLNLNSENFTDFFKNEKKNWRYMNNNTAIFFNARYSANSLHTYNSSLNFEENIKKTILKTSVVLSQQLAIPNEEFERFKKKFTLTKLENYKEPDVIIFNTNSYLEINSKINSEKYSKAYSGKAYILYLKK